MHSKAAQQPFVDAFLIHRKYYLEKKMITVLLTRDHGLISAITTLSKEKKQRLIAFNALSCQLLIKPSLSQLKKVELQTFQAPLKERFLLAGLYMNELIFRLCETNQEQTELYHLYAVSIQQLSQQQPLSRIVRHFEYRLQELLGYGLNFECLDDTQQDWFEFTPDTGLRPSNATQKKRFHRDQIKQLQHGHLDCPKTQYCSKQIFSIMLQHLLGEKHLFIKQVMPNIHQ